MGRHVDTGGGGMKKKDDNKLSNIRGVPVPLGPFNLSLEPFMAPSLISFACRKPEGAGRPNDSDEVWSQTDS